MRDVTDLKVYTSALENLENMYRLASQLPQQHRKLKYQLIESAEKIAPREFCRFLQIALGSSDEVITHIREVTIVAKTYKSIQINECLELIEKYRIISRKLNKLHSVWRKFT